MCLSLGDSAAGAHARGGVCRLLRDRECARLVVLVNQDGVREASIEDVTSKLDSLFGSSSTGKRSKWPGSSMTGSWSMVLR